MALTSAFSQQKYSVSAIVKDSSSGETLPGATIVVKGQNIGTATNESGFFSLTLLPGTYTIQFLFTGFQSKEITIDLQKNIHLDIEIPENINLEKEVIVTSDKSYKNVDRVEMGLVELDVEKIKALPAMMGEVDIMKTIQLLPGIQAGGEGNTGLYVRGGGADQNLILLDDALIYNTGHLFGFFSVFNADAIKSVTLHKGNMPAQYGGRLSSVLDFRMKEGNYKKYSATGGIGLISSRLTIEGPIVKNKGSFIISGRRTYIDVISRPFVESNGVKGVPYFFYDLNLKGNYKISSKDQVFFSSYIGRDQVSIGLLDGRLQSYIYWGNNTGTLKWTHRFSSKLNMDVAAVYNNYNFLSKATFDNFDTQVDSKITDQTAKIGFEYYPGVRHKVKFGMLYTFHEFIPRRAAGSASGVQFNATSNSIKYAQDAALYISDQYTISEKLDIAIGIRLNTFRQIGPYTYAGENLNDTISFGKREPVITFLNPEPRVGIRYKLNTSSSIKGAFNLNNQYIHQVSLSGNALPFDIWVASSRLIKPQRSLQYSLGYFKNLFENSFEFSVEGYYKDLTNQIEYRQDYIPRVSGEIENEFVFGSGQSYGVEFFLNKKSGNFQGWLGYTLAKATRKFDQINGGREFAARYDRRHDINLIGTYTINEKWTVGGTFVFATGQPITMPERRYLIEGVIYNQYGPRNSYRMQDYHRLDLSATYLKKRPNKKLESSWTFAIYNVYNRKNPYIYFIDADGDPINGELVVKAKKMFLFPILPSITWNFKF